MNILLISPDFPYTYSQFAKAFKNNNCRVFAIGGSPVQKITDELRSNVDEYIFCENMNNIKEIIDCVGYIVNKYGHIDFLESNNEYWLKTDATLRQWFNIDHGIFPDTLVNYQRKSMMKKYFEKAGCKVAPYIIVDDYISLSAFAQKYGFPLFAKPDIGVGSSKNYKIQNFDELHDFFTTYDKNCPYICEVFIKSSSIITYDGIVNKDSKVCVEDSMIFPSSIYRVKETSEDLFYYVDKSVDQRLKLLGQKILKAMGLKNRFFHIEFFKADDCCEGMFQKGDIVGIEVNIRTPGGYTTDLINYGLSTNVYQIFADVICFGKTNLTCGDKFYSCCCSRRSFKKYFFNDNDINRTFKDNLCFCGEYPQILSDIMGNQFYMAKFADKKDMDIFHLYVNKEIDQTQTIMTKTRRITGEDERIMREKNSRYDDTLSICDKHIDGA